jgi:hypothetical protein
MYVLYNTVDEGYLRTSLFETEYVKENENANQYETEEDAEEQLSELENSDEYIIIKIL